MSVYYNEFSQEKAAFLAQLMKDGFIPEGDIDTRPIQEITPYEIRRYKQAHFFAGIGIWSVSLRNAGHEETELWTGSCPCQSFSIAGKREGFADERNLWPFWFYLAEECRPPIIFGEQVATGLGPDWLDLVRSDLDGAGFSFGAADLSASSAMAPHGRPRFYFVALENSQLGRGRTNRTQLSSKPTKGRESAFTNKSAYAGSISRLEKETEIWRSRVSAHYWDDINWTKGRDLSIRPVKSEIQLLVDGSSTRTRGIVNAYGDGIVAPLAEQFIRSSMAAIEDLDRWCG